MLNRNKNKENKNEKPADEIEDAKKPEGVEGEEAKGDKAAKVDEGTDETTKPEAGDGVEADPADQSAAGEVVNASNSKEDKDNPAQKVTDTKPVTAFRRNIDEFTPDYQGQSYQITATKDGKPNFIVGYSHAPDGGGAVELVDSSPELSGPFVQKLEPDEKNRLEAELLVNAGKGNKLKI